MRGPLASTSGSAARAQIGIRERSRMPRQITHDSYSILTNTRSFITLIKRIVIASLVACFALLTAACSDDVEDACEHTNELCASKAGYQKADCAKQNDAYDKLTDAQKEKADKQVECAMDADTCDGVIACLAK